MEDNQPLLAALAMTTLDAIPQPQDDAKEITGLVKKGGEITGYQLSNGTLRSKKEAVEQARQGEIRGVGVAL